MQGIDIAGFLQQLPLFVIPTLFAITVHEVAHGWVAKQCGDPTALFAGRLTLNPIKHIDPLGTVIVPLVLLLLTNFAFGWAKPVPVAFNNLKKPRRDMILVAAAGPGSNLLMATGWSVFGAIVFMAGGEGLLSQWLVGMCIWGIQINVILAVFNLLPIPPLDGGRVLAGLLPPRMARVLDGIEPFGFMIVILLMVTGVLWTLLEPLRLFFLDFFFAVLGLR